MHCLDNSNNHDNDTTVATTTTTTTTNNNNDITCPTTTTTTPTTRNDTTITTGRNSNSTFNTDNDNNNDDNNNANDGSIPCPPDVDADYDQNNTVLNNTQQIMQILNQEEINAWYVFDRTNEQKQGRLTNESNGDAPRRSPEWFRNR